MKIIIFLVLLSSFCLADNLDVSLVLENEKPYLEEFSFEDGVINVYLIDKNGIDEIINSGFVKILIDSEWIDMNLVKYEGINAKYYFYIGDVGSFSIRISDGIDEVVIEENLVQTNLITGAVVADNNEFNLFGYIKQFFSWLFS